MSVAVAVVVAYWVSAMAGMDVDYAITMVMRLALRRVIVAQSGLTS